MDDKAIVKERTDLSDLIGSYREIRRQGANYVTKCPWHDDTKPSLSINMRLGLWRCWPCDIGGDCFDWVMRNEGCSFSEALQKLADRAGVTLSNHDSEGASRKRELLDIMERCCKLYQSELTGDVLEYLHSRGINKQSIEKYRIGYAPNDNQYLFKKGLESSLLLETGMTGEAQRGAYERFRDRLIFPITDLSGRVIAFGGRQIPGHRAFGGKYVNSPDSPLFDKSVTLYGLEQASGAIRKEGVSLVMEGYTDVIAASQAGVENSVAVLGVALRSDHAKKLMRFGDQIAVILDGDEAGQKNSERTLEVIIGMDSRVVELPSGSDPAEYVAKNGADALRNLVKHAKTPVEFQVGRAFRGFDPKIDIGSSRRAIEKVMSLVDNKGPMFREQAEIAVAAVTGLSLKVVRGIQQAKPVKAQVKEAEKEEVEPVKSLPKLSLIDREVVAILACGGDAVPLALEGLDREPFHPLVRALFRCLEHLDENGQDIRSFSVVLNAINNPDLRSVVAEAAERADSGGVGSGSSYHERLGCVQKKLALRTQRKMKLDSKAQRFTRSAS